MNAPIPKITIEHVDLRGLPMTTRFPFRYGIASMTSVLHVFVTLRTTIDGHAATGVSSEGLAPKWFTKNPDSTLEEDRDEMLRVIHRAADTLRAGNAERSFFDIWKDLHDDQAAWANSEGVPPLLANLGVSLMERAVIDALCRYLQRPFHQIIRESRLGLALGALDSSLPPTELAAWLPPAPQSRIFVRHTVGLGDPLTDGDVDTPLDDGCPQSLEANIRAYDLRYFKVKLSGDLGIDTERLAALQDLLTSLREDRYVVTLDGNEQFQHIAEFQEHWETYRAHPSIHSLLEHVPFVEQPLHRDRALGDELREALRAWPAAPPMIIDESDADLDSLPKALALGYSGTSHKNCKGIVKGLLNAARLAHRRSLQPGASTVLSGEDLASVGPVAMLQDLTVAAALGIDHIERNGHHYFRGLSMLPEIVQQQVLDNHLDLYRKHEHGFPTLDIRDGQLSLDSLNQSPFAPAFLLDAACFQELPPPPSRLAITSAPGCD